MTPQTNLAVVQAVYAAFDKGNLDLALSHYDAEVVVHHAPSLPYGGNFHGVAEVRQFITQLVQTWDNPQFPVDEFLEVGSKVVVREHFHATARSSGKQIKNMPVLEVFTVHNFKVVEVEVFYFDTAALLAALNS